MLQHVHFVFYIFPHEDWLWSIIRVNFLEKSSRKSVHSLFALWSACKFTSITRHCTRFFFKSGLFISAVHHADDRSQKLIKIEAYNFEKKKPNRCATAKARFIIGFSVWQAPGEFSPAYAFNISISHIMFRGLAQSFSDFFEWFILGSGLVSRDAKTCTVHSWCICAALS